MSPTPTVSFSGPQNRETNLGNETIGGGLKRLEVNEDFLLIQKPPPPVYKWNKWKIGDSRYSSSIKGVKINNKCIHLQMLLAIFNPGH